MAQAQRNCGLWLQGISLVRTVVLVLDPFVFDDEDEGRGDSTLPRTATSRFDALRLRKALSLSKGTFPGRLGGRFPKVIRHF